MAKSTIKASKSSIKPGESNTITITRSSSSYTHTIKYTVGKLTGTVATKTTSTSVKVTVPLDAITQSPNKSQTCTITCTTYSGSTSLGSSTCTFAVAPYSPNYIIAIGFSEDNLGEELTLNVDKDNSNFTSTVTYSFEGSSTTTVVSKSSATEINFTPPVSLASYIPELQYGTLTIKLGTYYKDTKIGATQTSTIVLGVPDSVKPTITSNGWTDTSGYATKYGAPVASKSTIKLTANCKGIYGSKIYNVYYAVNSNSKIHEMLNAEEVASEMQFPANVISWTADKFVYSITAQDSRSHLSDTVFSEEIAVLSYKAPQIRNTAYRSDASGNKLEDGTYVKFSFIHAFSDLNNKNSKRVNIYRDNTKIYTAELTNYNSSTDVVTSGWSRDVTYTYKVELVDDFSTTAVTGKIEPVFSLINFNTNGTALAFGGVSTKSNTVEFYMPLYTDKSFLFSNGSSISQNGNNLQIGTSAANSYVTLKDAASANGTDKWTLSADGVFNAAKVCVATGGAYWGKDSNGAEKRLILLTGSNNVAINPMETGTGWTNIYGGTGQVVQLGSGSEPVNIKHNGHDILDTEYMRDTTAVSCAHNTWTTTKASITLHKGLWIITGKVSFAAATGKRRGIRLFNATDSANYSISQVVYGGSTSSQTIYVNTMMIVNIAATKVFKVQAYQDTGSTINETEAVIQAVCIG